ncbi:MAG: 4-alpha-glucanotransferase [Deltaproteobacteria bacterium]|nr:4-alpha-glucanotransferase [Deltaproteobacteria bacterium]
MDARERDLLARLARFCGIAEGYHDIWGKYHEASDETRRALLRAMDVDVAGVQAMEGEVRCREEGRQSLLCEPVAVAAEGENPSLPLNLAEVESESSVEVRNEATGELLQARIVGAGEGGGRLEIERPLEPGLYPLRVSARSPSGAVRSSSTRLIVSPARGYEPGALAEGGRIWGVNLPLYGLRSGRNWGIGDFEDLRTAVSWVAGLGGDLVGLLPLHALFNAEPYGVSPYYPSSRLFLNPIYIAVDRVPEAADPEGRSLLESGELRTRIEELRSAEFVDYPGVWALKRAALERLYDLFLNRHGADSDRRRAFDGWRRAQGAALEDFATFCALRDHLARHEGRTGVWQEWPEEFRTPRSEGVTRFRGEHSGEVGFHAYLQWIAHEQLAGAGEAACDGRMGVGLYLDMALGVDPSGADAWRFQDVLARGASAGCPPDPFSLLGQRWGLPPPIPERHRGSGYEYFLETVGRTAADVGALRIDHVLALWRLFWVPGELPPSEGVYVFERADELLALLRLVSRKARCLIVGEDLGTIPPEVRKELMASGFCSYRVLIFE